MGRADSPLRDRVIFVEGAPRSGTTWLVTLLATHPEIAGVEAESHLFDFGVDRLFDNIEGRERMAGLATYLDREELVDLTRDLCDGVLIAMRSHVSVGSLPEFVVEKTPISDMHDGRDLVRKRDCYPDAWYIHIVRDREAVKRSLMRAPWMENRSPAECAALWDRAVGYARNALGDLPRYREIAYEDLRRDPAETCRDLFEWLGVRADDAILETMEALSHEPFSDLGAPPAPRARLSAAALAAAARRLPSGARALAGRGLDRLATDGRTEPSTSALAFTFVRALRERDAEALRSLSASSLELLYRSPDGDRVLRGEEAHAGLVQIAEETFNRRYVSEWWASAGGGPGEWWTRIPDRPFWTIFLSAIGADATRVDVAIGLVLEGELVHRVVVITAGALAGRPIAPAAARRDA